MSCPYKKVNEGKKKFEQIIEESDDFNEAKLTDKLLNFLKSKER